MPIDTDAPFRPDPRLVPTLTQVVGRPAEPGTHDDPPQEPVDVAVQDSPAPAPAEPAAVAGPTAAALQVEQVLATLGDDLDRRLEETVASVLHEQMPGLAACMRAAVAETVRAAVAEALQRGLPDSADSKNP